jgi:hypothetical protein
VYMMFWCGAQKSVSMCSRSVHFGSHKWHQCANELWRVAPKKGANVLGKCLGWQQEIVLVCKRSVNGGTQRIESGSSRKFQGFSTKFFSVEENFRCCTEKRFASILEKFQCGRKKITSLCRRSVERGTEETIQCPMEVSGLHPKWH